MEPEKPPRKLSGMEWFFVFASAVIVDLFQIIIGFFLPVAGEVANVVINFFYGAALAYYLHHKGISIFRARNLITFFAAFAVDEISLGLLPAWTLDVAITWAFTKADENPHAWYARFINPAKRVAKIASVVNKINPLNKDGVRSPNPKIPPTINSGGSRLPSKV